MRNLLLIMTATVLFSCGGGESTTTEENKQDTAKVEETTVDTSNTIVEETTVTEVAAEGKSIEEVEKSGGLSFCDCVKKQKEIDDKMIITDDDAGIEALLAESEKLRNGECAVLKAGPQMTAAEKKAREAKVNACLNK